MELLRVFNNNVVLARRETTGSPASAGEEVIVTGRGIGFRAHQGQLVDPAKIVKVFVPEHGRDPDHSAEMLASVPGVFVRIVIESMRAAATPKELCDKLSFVVAVADHVSMAVKRYAEGVQVAYPLRAEVEHLYGEDFLQACRILTEINTRLDSPLPADEAVALTLHLVNAGFSTGDLSHTFTMTGLIQQVIEVVSTFYGQSLDTTTASVARFITHLRYLFVRVAEHGQLDAEMSPVAQTILEAYPRAATCAAKLESLLELRLNQSLSKDEIAYLTLHIARLEPAEER